MCHPASYSGHPHHHFLVGTAEVVWSQLAEDVQNSITTVVLENSPDMPTCPLSAVCGGVRRVPLNTNSIFTAGTDWVTEVFCFLIIQHFPLLVHSLPALKDPVN